MSSGSRTENVWTSTYVICRENHHKVLMSLDPSIRWYKIHMFRKATFILTCFGLFCKSLDSCCTICRIGAAWRWHGPDTDPFVLPHESLMNDFLPIDSFLPRTARRRNKLMANATVVRGCAVGIEDVLLSQGVTPTPKLQRIPCNICRRSSRTMQYCIATVLGSVLSCLVYFLPRIISERIWATRHATRNLVIRPM